MKDGTRLNAGLRRSIKKAVMSHRFGKDIDELRKELAEIAILVYERTYSLTNRNLMASLPEGWLDTDPGISVKVMEQQHYLHFAGRIYWKKRYMDDSGYFYDRLSKFEVEKEQYLVPHTKTAVQITFNDPLSKRLRAAQLKQEKLQEALDGAWGKIDTMLGSYTTVGALKKAWPEVEPFIPASSDVPAKPMALPAVLPSTLNAILDLPV